MLLTALPDGAPLGLADAQPGSVWHAIDQASEENRSA